MRAPRLFPRRKQQVALSPVSGFYYSQEDLEQIIFDQTTGTRV